MNPWTNAEYVSLMSRWLSAAMVSNTSELLPDPDTPVKTVSKTRCDVLVTAEAGTQSGKARKAMEYGKPVFTADEFFAWLSAAE